MSEHHENPFDHPHEWIQEEAMSDIRLDALALADAPATGRLVFREACASYSAAVADQALGWDRQPAVASPGSVVVTVTPMAPGFAQPNTLAVANGPDWSLVLVLRSNGLSVGKVTG